MLAFALYERLRHTTDVNTTSRAFAYWSLATIAAFIAFLQFKPQGLSDLLIYPLSAAVVLSVAFVPKGGLGRLIDAAPLVWLGAVSYSIYMVHAAVEAAINLAIRMVTHAKEIRLPLHDAPVLRVTSSLGLALAVVAVVLVLVISHFTFAWIEKPWRDWSKSAWLRVSSILAPDPGPS